VDDRHTPRGASGGRSYEAGGRDLSARRAPAETHGMAEFKRPLLIAVAAAVVLLALIVAMPRPHPVAVRNTPLAPVQAIQKARAVSGLSDRANQQLQAAGDAAGR
jgi:hypothetical protein